jgi:hypothetical protein
MLDEKEELIVQRDTLRGKVNFVCDKRITFEPAAVGLKKLARCLASLMHVNNKIH